ncbi:integrase [Bacillus cereus]|nr:integrase [Bacillus cereus]
MEKKLKWKSGEITAVMFMEMLELKKNTFYKIMKEYTEANYPLIYREC